MAYVQESKSTRPKPQRATLRNLSKLLASGDIFEIMKVLRRRFLNLLKFTKRALLFVFYSYYDRPSVRHKRQRRQLHKILANYYSFDHTADKPGALNIALIIADGDTYPKSSAFIRLIGPLTHGSVRGKISLKLYRENVTKPDDRTDVCIVQRTAFDDLQSANQLLNNLRAAGTKLVIDTDDAFHSIRKSHPEYLIHSPRIEAFNYLIEKADQIWISTNQLADSLEKYQKKVFVVPNSLDKRLWANTKDPSQASGYLKMLYMGTGTHDSDFAMILPALDALSIEYPDQFELTIIGVGSDVPDRDWLKRAYAGRNGSIYPRFVQWFLRQGPFDIGLSPLVDNEFNRNKSDIKCLDYLAAGIIPVVSDIEPYRLGELDEFIIRIPNTAQAWKKKISELINDPDDLRQKKGITIPKAQKYLWQKRSSDITAQRLITLLQALVKNT